MPLRYLFQQDFQVLIATHQLLPENQMLKEFQPHKNLYHLLSFLLFLIQAVQYLFLYGLKNLYLQ